MLRLCTKCNLIGLAQACDTCGGDTCGCKDCRALASHLVHRPGVAREARRMAVERCDALEAKLTELSAVPLVAVAVVCAGDSYSRPVIVPCDGVAEADVPQMLRNLADSLERAAQAAKAGDN